MLVNIENTGRCYTSDKTKNTWRRVYCGLFSRDHNKRYALERRTKGVEGCASTLHTPTSPHHAHITQHTQPAPLEHETHATHTHTHEIHI